MTKKSEGDAGVDDLVVDREQMMRIFDPPIGKTKFHELVNQGLIVKARGLGVATR